VAYVWDDGIDTSAVAWSDAFSTDALNPTLYYAIYLSTDSEPTWDRTTGWSGSPVAQGSEAAPTVTGTYDWSTLATGLTASTSYRIDFVWDDGSDTSTVTWSDAFTTLSDGITGTLAAQEVGDDTVAISGSVTVSGSLAAQEVGDDTVAISGTVSSHRRPDDRDQRSMDVGIISTRT